MATNISSLIINAPVQKAWDALTKPELVKQWQFGSTLITSWQPGDEIRFRAEWENQVFEQWGKVL
ncbi:MAG TPA: SRPBCC domain-containing protein [Flavitalea sp.]|nr:SRPBCC domain-containing protein [Flavitalea sp.]